MKNGKIWKAVVTSVMVILLVFGMSICAFAQPTDDELWEIYDINDLSDLFNYGGSGILMNDIDPDEEYYVMDLNSDVVLNMNGHSIYYSGDNCIFNANLLLYSDIKTSAGRLPCLDIIVNRGWAGVYWENWGNMVTQNISIRASDIDQKGVVCVIDGEYDISYADENNGLVVFLNDTFGTMTADQSFALTQTLTLPELTRDGYNFIGWTKKDGTAVSDLSGMKGYVTIKANWESNIDVTFDSNGGTCEAEILSPDNDTMFSKLPTAERIDYCFDGWELPNGEKATTETEFLQPTTLKAIWVPETDRADELTQSMEEMGFSKDKIEQTIKGLSNGSILAATIFIQANIWLTIALVLIVAGGVAAAVLIIKKKKR